MQAETSPEMKRSSIIDTVKGTIAKLTKGFPIVTETPVKNTSEPIYVPQIQNTNSDTLEWKKKSGTAECITPESIDDFLFKKTDSRQYPTIETLADKTVSEHALGKQGERSSTSTQSDATIFRLEDINILKLVGKGGFAKVYQIRRKSDSKIFALKVMRKDHVRKTKQVANVINENMIQRTVQETKFIVRIFSSFQDPVHLFIVQEYLGGGDLFNLIKSYGHLQNSEAQYYAAEIVLGLSYLHSKKIVFRDLKPENLIFGYDGHLRIGDLGFAKVLHQETTKSFSGTPSYLAPEVLKRIPYGLAVDWWTFGVIVFQLCSGCSPFQESHPTKTFTRILNCAIRWPPNPQNYFTNDCFDLIMRLFELDPKERITEKEITHHEWFASMDFRKLNMGMIPPPQNIFAFLQNKKENATFPENEVDELNTMFVELSTGSCVESSERLFKDF